MSKKHSDVARAAWAKLTPEERKHRGRLMSAGKRRNQPTIVDMVIFSLKIERELKTEIRAMAKAKKCTATALIRAYIEAGLHADSTVLDKSPDPVSQPPEPLDIELPRRAEVHVQAYPFLEPLPEQLHSSLPKIRLAPSSSQPEVSPPSGSDPDVRSPAYKPPRKDPPS